MGRRGQEMEFKAHSKRQEGARGLPQTETPLYSPLSELTHPRATNPAKLKCLSWMVKSSLAPTSSSSSLSAR